MMRPDRRLCAFCGRAGWTGNDAQNLRFCARGTGGPDDPHRGRAATCRHSRAGRDRMIAELNGMVEKFHDMDVRIQRLTEPVMRDLGIRDDVLQRLMEDFKRKAHAGEPI